MCFPVNFAKFRRTPFFTEHLRWLLLNHALGQNTVHLNNLYANWFYANLDHKSAIPLVHPTKFSSRMEDVKIWM